MIIRKILKKLDIFYVFICLFIIVLFHTLILEYFAIKNEEESLPSSNKGKNNNSLRKTSSQRNVMKKNFKINEPVPKSIEEGIAMALNTPFFKKSNKVKNKTMYKSILPWWAKIEKMLLKSIISYKFHRLNCLLIGKMLGRA